ncbi:hypothetical protein HDF26_001009 [Pedobacter cryoconitis]|uniref:hypothetical protein n=1 Tax=Pedobacter cryoconitis TaxID=188932 RepID=UPI00161E87D3|nr:hypothetical protein [Pedobacter cryoconitis]MBB6270582.1 hypothetical protein [Pedobacter cryoconitis]
MIAPYDLRNVIYEIERCDLPEVKRNSETGTFELKANSSLLSNLSGNYGAFIVRSILHKLNINEHHVFKWRLENKFRQYQILNYYFPDCMPKTLSFSKLLNQPNGIWQIKELFANGFFLKATLGDASFSNKNWDKTAEFDSISKLHNEPNVEYESYMLQKKLDLQCEFRVHTFSKDIIPGLVYVMQGQIPPDKRTGVEKFVNEVLRKLPDVILQGTMIAWDIALTNNDQYYVIEANFTGFHPEYRAGFQTTGYVDDHHYGSIICAWLNNYFNQKFGVYIDAIDSSLLANYPFYEAFLFYRLILKNEHIDLIKNKTKDNPVSIIIYLGEETNNLIISLIKHFLLVDFADKYYVITKNEYFQKVGELFSGNYQISVWSEHELFTQDQRQLVEQLGYDRRKQIGCYHAVRRLKSKPYVII